MMYSTQKRLSLEIEEVFFISNFCKWLTFQMSLINNNYMLITKSEYQ